MPKKKHWESTWVTKTDVVEYLRCPYRHYVSQKMNIPIHELKDQKKLERLLSLGKSFERQMVEEKGFAELESLEHLEEVKNNKMVFKTAQLFENHELGITGIPDLIDMGNGALYPIEIKSHRYVQPLDKNELAFYWKLLEPMRKTSNELPKGYVLTSDGRLQEVEIDFMVSYETERAIQAVRAIRDGDYHPNPALSQECSLCLVAKECQEILRECGDLTIIYNLKAKRKAFFQQIGINNIKELSKADAQDIHERMCAECHHSPGFDEIRRMQAHAFSIMARKPVFFGDDNDCGVFNRPKMIIDLEYNTVDRIWLVGILVDEGETQATYQYFSEENTQRNEKMILKNMISIIKKYPQYPIITFGSSAEIPTLRTAWRRQRLPEADFEQICERNIDLGTFMCDSFRLPTVDMKLKTIEQYMGFKRRFKNMDGLQAQFEYEGYLAASTEKRKATIRGRLIRYNNEDLKGTFYIANKVKTLRKSAIS